MTESGNMQVCGNLLDFQLTDDSAGCCVWNVLVLGQLWLFGWSAKNGVEKTSGSARLLDSLVSGHRVGLLLYLPGLGHVECSLIVRCTVKQMQRPKQRKHAPRPCESYS